KVFPSFEAAKKLKDEKYTDSILITDGKVWDILIVPALEKDLAKYHLLFKEKFPWVQDSDAIPFSSNGHFIIRCLTFDGITITKGPSLA
ncbi:MAG: hypothetical protein K2Q22_09930, partial [Cytophagales bacterium]|nr:hypothetical protein [Cytophagales bacterium]